MLRNRFPASSGSSTSSAKKIFALLFLVAFAVGWTTFAGAVEGNRGLEAPIQEELWKGEPRLDRVAMQRFGVLPATPDVKRVKQGDALSEQLMKICSWLKKGMTQAQVAAQMKRSGSDGLSVFFPDTFIPEFDCRANHRVCFIERYFPIPGQKACRLNILFGDFRVLDYYVTFPSVVGQ